jgi:hypothetical protein
LGLAISVCSELEIASCITFQSVWSLKEKAQYLFKHQKYSKSEAYFCGDTSTWTLMKFRRMAANRHSIINTIITITHMLPRLLRSTL